MVQSESKVIQIEQVEDVTVVSFGAGAITGGTGVDDVGTALRRHVAEVEPRRLVVDFAGVTFFSSMMLGLLVDTWRRTRDYGGSLIIAGVNPNLCRVFRITSLDRIFDFAPDRQTALAAIRTK